MTYIFKYEKDGCKFYEENDIQCADFIKRDSDMEKTIDELTDKLLDGGHKISIINNKRKIDFMIDDVKSIIKERGNDYGSSKDSFSKIAAMWSAYTGCNISSTDVAYMMAMLKMSREKSSPKFDNRLDAAAYCILADEVSHGI
jgi:phenylalanyl-tRNA synthetase beta subunit